MATKLLWLTVFSITFGFTEAAVASLVRLHFGYISNWPPDLNLVLANLPSALFRAEQIRELATGVMIIAVAILSGVNTKQRPANFLIVFSLWMIFYYVWLKVLLDWPKSLWDIDLYMVVFATRIGPVIYSLGLFLITLPIGLYLYIKSLPAQTRQSSPVGTKRKPGR